MSDKPKVQIHVHPHPAVQPGTIIITPQGPCPRCGLWGCPDDPRPPTVARNVGA